MTASCYPQIPVFRKVPDSREPGDLPSDGLVFDVDISRRRKQPDGLPRAEIKNFLESAADHTYDLLNSLGYGLFKGCNDDNK